MNECSCVHTRMTYSEARGSYSKDLTTPIVSFDSLVESFANLYGKTGDTGYSARSHRDIFSFSPLLPISPAGETIVD